MAELRFDRDTTALLVVDPYNDFISEGGKIWPKVKAVAEANNCVANMLQVLNAARAAKLRVFYALHRRYRPGDYESWKHIAPIERAAWQERAFELGSWGGEIRKGFEPQPSDIIASEHWCSSGFANTDLDQKLTVHGINHIIVIGLRANTCIEATVRFAAELGYDVTMVKDATASVSAEEMHASLEVNIPNYAQAVVSTIDVVAALSPQPRPRTARVASAQALGIVLCLALPYIARAQATLNRKHDMTHIAASTGVGDTKATRTPNGDEIRPFSVHISDSALADLRRRIEETRWPDRETVPNASQGVQEASLQALMTYWANDYDWRKVEAGLNALPQFVTNIEGVDIHFIHVRSRQKNALPIIITHGWPGSVIEQLKIIDPLTNPTAHGARAEDAFDVIIPSLPGYGFSGKPEAPGWDPDHIARAWTELMKRLGYTRYVAQGGDWGSAVSEAMALQAPRGLLAVHVNLPAVTPPEIVAALASGGPAPTGLSAEERASFEGSLAGAKKGALTYFAMMTARPQTIGYGVADSPAFLAAWILVHPGFAAWKFGTDPQQTLTRDDVLDDISLYWLTNSGTSSGRLYWENMGRGATSSAAWKTNEIKVPVAITLFGEDAFQPPESWVRRAFPTLMYFHRTEKGGHFAAWEQPELFAQELRAAFKSLREPDGAK